MVLMKTDQPEVEDVTSRTAAPAGESLADLAREADLLDTSPDRAAVAGAEAAVAEQVVSTSSELLGLLTMLRAMVFPILGMAIDARRMAALQHVWNDGVLGQSAAAGAQVMALHGWTLNGAFDKYGPYVMLAAALGPPVLLTKKIMEPDKKADEAPAASSTTPTADGQQQ